MSKVLEQRLETLQRELDVAISAASYARTEKQHPEAGKKAAELHVEEMIKELENTTNFEEVREDENEEDVEERHPKQQQYTQQTHTDAL
ncbi:hypothetical protein Tco_0152503 [Tanacetum coccineum]